MGIEKMSIKRRKPPLTLQTKEDFGLKEIEHSAAIRNLIVTYFFDFLTHVTNVSELLTGLAKEKLLPALFPFF